MSYEPVHIGTSGWSYNHWQGCFYPVDLPDKSWLEYYAERFSSVEINSSFYRLPEPNTLVHWRDSVPDRFVFSVKASRFITHMKKLKEPAASIATFFERISILEEKLGPILFQLPPRWRFNAERLAAFLTSLSSDFRYVFEFRDHSWHNPAALELLSRHKAAFCIYELDGFLSGKEVTTDLVYLRLHGPAGPYQGSYDDQALSGWADKFSRWSKNGYRVYCYFDNDQAGYAVQNAARLRAMLAAE